MVKLKHLHACNRYFCFCFTRGEGLTPISLWHVTKVSFHTHRRTFKSKERALLLLSSYGRNLCHDQFDTLRIAS